MLNNYYSTKLVIKESLLEKNINFFKSKIPLGTKIIAVIKANAYGYGDLEMACRLLTHNIAYLAVADFEEGLRLRNNGIQSPIMVMNTTSNSLQAIIDYKLEPVVYSKEILNYIINTKINTFKLPLLIHIKINTGMNRWGFIPSEIPGLISIIKKTLSLFFK